MQHSWWREILTYKTEHHTDVLKLAENVCCKSMYIYFISELPASNFTISATKCMVYCRSINIIRTNYDTGFARGFRLHELLLLVIFSYLWNILKNACVTPTVNYTYAKNRTDLPIHCSLLVHESSTNKRTFRHNIRIIPASWVLSIRTGSFVDDVNGCNSWTKLIRAS